MQNHFQVLDWDSGFFEKKIAQVEKNLFSRSEQEQILRELAEEQVELAYYLSDEPVDKVPEDLYEFNMILKKTPIHKDLKGEEEIHENISFYTEPEPTKDLLDLAYRAGEWSRFSFDPKIDERKVRKLYEDWITKSVQKEMASEVLVYRQKGKIIGMVTLKIEVPHGQTPLFAVSREAEGKGVSFALMKAADAVLYQKGCSFYTSATQAENRAAVTIFRRHGFDIKPVEYVYHLWKK